MMQWGKKLKPYNVFITNIAIVLLFLSHSSIAEESRLSSKAQQSVVVSEKNNSSSVEPRLQRLPIEAPTHFRAVIQDNSLSHIHGILSVNQAAGDHNLQLNQALVGQGSFFSDLDDQHLSLQSVATESKGDIGQSQSMADMEIKMEKSVLVGTEGLVQINQAAGGANTAHNIFVLEDLTGR